MMLIVFSSMMRLSIEGLKKHSQAIPNLRSRNPQDSRENYQPLSEEKLVRYVWPRACTNITQRLKPATGVMQWTRLKPLAGLFVTIAMIHMAGDDTRFLFQECSLAAVIHYEKYCSLLHYSFDDRLCVVASRTSDRTDRCAERPMVGSR